jgi:predicted DsbA family dithiol-disulfide isomerase
VTIQIDVFHDTVCPWCRIGKRHLQMALSEWQGEPVSVAYHTYFLNPDIPPQGYPFREYMHAKGGGQVPLEDWFAAPRTMGTQVGLVFDFERIERAPNSSLSHQLIALADSARREMVIDATYAAYFEHGKDISALEVLVEIARSAGMDGELTRQALLSGEKRGEIEAQVQQARQIGITGVPFFIFNRRLAFSGAQPPHIIRQVLEQAQAFV